jgi:sugar phosphate isomerase/epimerase
MKRKEALRALGLTTAGIALAPQLSSAQKEKTAAPSKFKFCLNTSTISGQKASVKKYIEIASQAGYDGVELWVRDVKAYIEEGNSLKALRKFLNDSDIVVYSAIGFAPWMAENETQRNAGFTQMKEEMEMMSELGCVRIAAPSSGVPASAAPLNLNKIGERYKQLLDLGRQTGVMPQLEFWGASPVFSTFGQALMVAAVANDPDVHILPDVYHLFRGGSGFDCLKMVNGKIIDVIHFNDFVSTIPREQQKDDDRVYPGDGVAPFKQIIADLSNMGGTKILSLELFNREYWKLEPLVIAKTGLQKMKKLT